jgi:hypothetical protein
MASWLVVEVSFALPAGWAYGGHLGMLFEVTITPGPFIKSIAFL